MFEFVDVLCLCFRTPGSPAHADVQSKLTYCEN